MGLELGIAMSVGVHVIEDQQLRKRGFCQPGGQLGQGLIADGKRIILHGETPMSGTFCKFRVTEGTNAHLQNRFLRKGNNPRACPGLPGTVKVTNYESRIPNFMSNLVEQLSGQLSGPALKALSQQLGADQGTTNAAISAALPMLLGALDKNTNDPQGAQSLQQALNKDHDGSILNNLEGFLGSADSGTGPAILGHIFGQKQSTVEQGVSKISGLDQSVVPMLLQNLAPIVMGYLGKQQREQNLDAGSLSSMLTQEREAVQARGGSTASVAVDMVTKLMDQDGDGSMLDDIGGIVGRFF